MIEFKAKMDSVALSVEELSLELEISGIDKKTIKQLEGKLTLVKKTCSKRCYKVLVKY